MSNIIRELSKLNIYHEVKIGDKFIDAVVGESKNMQIRIYMKYYEITVTSKDKQIYKKFSYDIELLNAILEMQKLASLYL